MNIMSFVSLIVSALGVIAYGAIFDNLDWVLWLFVMFGIVSMALPLIAKKMP